MCERLAALLVTLALIVTPAFGGPTLAVDIVDLPFKVDAMRNADSEVALAVATSGVLPIARQKPVSADLKAAVPPNENVSIAVVWGEGGGAVLSADVGDVATTLLGAETVAGFAEAEQPKVAVPGSRRAVSGPITAYFTGPTGMAGRAAGLTIRERRPLAVTSEPKPVPVATSTVAPGADLTFVADKPRLTTLDGKPVVLVATQRGDGASSLAVVSKSVDNWRIDAQSASKPEQGVEGTPLAIAAVADFLGLGRPQIAAARPRADGASLELWDYANGALTLVAETPMPVARPRPGQAVLAAVLPPNGAGPADLAVATSDGSALIVLAFKGAVRERARVALPAPAATGIAVLGRGSAARIFIGLADGRLASVAANGMPQ